MHVLFRAFSIISISRWCTEVPQYNHAHELQHPGTTKSGTDRQHGLVTPLRIPGKTIIDTEESASYSWHQITPVARRKTLHPRAHHVVNPRYDYPCCEYMSVKIASSSKERRDMWILSSVTGRERWRGTLLKLFALSYPLGLPQTEYRRGEAQPHRRWWMMTLNAAWLLIKEPVTHHSETEERLLLSNHHTTE